MTRPKPTGKVQRWHIRQITSAHAIYGPCPRLDALAEAVIAKGALAGEEAAYIRDLATRPKLDPKDFKK